jgi:hypothetical protein
MKTDLLQEEPLIFASGKTCIDPKIGMTLFGPSSWKSGEFKEIIAGVIGTNQSVSHFLTFLEKINHRTNIIGDPKPWKREFPGLGPNSPLHFSITIGKDMIELISEEEEDQVLSSPSRKYKILAARDLYEEKISNLLETVHPDPDIVYIPLSRKLIEHTSDKRFDTDKIRYEYRTLQKGAYREKYIPLFDFHHSLKVIGFKYRKATQLIRPSTYEMSAYGQQDLASSFWNFSVASYYKATGTPWKLANLDEETCYVGISFYEDPNPEEPNMRTSMAHVYLKTGESQIIRGKAFKWDFKHGRVPYLDTDQAYSILSEVIKLFETQKRRKPLRVVVHKSSQYRDDEIEGFSKASEGIEGLDLVHIYQKSKMRFFYGQNNFPPIRGTLFQNSSSPSFLYTVGYIPALGTYPGQTDPVPLEFSWARKSRETEVIAKDILALTRLDWNNCDYCREDPVTISVADKVGEILAESSSRNVVPPSSYSFYM